MKKLLAILLLFLPFPAWAATTANTFIAPQTPQRESYQYTSASTPAAYTTVYTAGANGSIITALIESNTDSSATHVVNCSVYNATIQLTSSTAITTTSPAAGSWNNINIMATWTGLPLDQNGNPFLILVSGDTLQCTYATAITAAKFVVITAIGADY
jgi:hypothetical protein